MQAAAKLDRYAACCASGVLDACGVCDGKAKLVDAQVGSEHMAGQHGQSLSRLWCCRSCISLASASTAGTNQCPFMTCRLRCMAVVLYQLRLIGMLAVCAQTPMRACTWHDMQICVQAVCCASGVLDGAGFCCASGALDECGVCDGDGASCALHAVVNVQASTREVCTVKCDLGCLARICRSRCQNPSDALDAMSYPLCTWAQPWPCSLPCMHAVAGPTHMLNYEAMLSVVLPPPLNPCCLPCPAKIAIKGASHLPSKPLAPVQVSQPASLVSLGPQGFVSSFVAFASSLLNVSSSLVAVTDFVLAPGARLAAGEASVGMVVDFVVSPPDSYSPDQVCLQQVVA